VVSSSAAASISKKVVLVHTTTPSPSTSRTTAVLVDSPSRHKNQRRDDQGSFDEKDSSRQASSPTVSVCKNLAPATTRKRKVTLSFDETETASDTEETTRSVHIKGSVSRDSGSTFDSTDSDAPLIRLENVTALSRSLIAPELQQLLRKPPLHPSNNKRVGSKNMATPAVSNGNAGTSSNSNSGGGGGGGDKRKKGMFRRKLSLRRSKSLSGMEEKVDGSPTPSSSQSRRTHAQGEPRLPTRPPTKPPRRAHSKDDDDDGDEGEPTEALPPTPQRSNRKTAEEDESNKAESGGRRGVLQRIRSASRSRSKARLEQKVGETTKPILVAVTSCRSDAYYNQKAPGSTSKLPRKAPSNLKLFHELAVGIKDAYAAVGQTPTRPDEETEDVKQNAMLMEGKTVLWEFVGNLDFLLALVDEVAIDTATRGALKDDTTFKCLRDVIKKCNKVLEGMLVRRERRYTLFFRLVQPTEPREVAKIKSWNSKVEKAIGSVADPQAGNVSTSESDDAGSTSGASSITDTSESSSRSGLFARGRQLLPSAGRVRARRATPTPRLRNRGGTNQNDSDSSAAEDGFSAGTPVTKGNLALLQKSMDNGDGNKNSIPALMPAPPPNQPKFGNTVDKPVQPKDELIDVIRGLRTEKIQKREGTAESELALLKPNWQPKADIPSSVPKLPTEYIHRHRLMKQAVNCLLDQNGAGPRDTDDEVQANTIITSITSRHADKPGNGKTTLAVAAIQTVEVRERFSDGIAWIQLGRNPLTEKEVRRLYEELFRQLVAKDDDGPDDDEDLGTDDGSKDGEKLGNGNLSRSASSLDKNLRLIEDENAIRLAESRQRFQGGELDAIKEDLANIITKRKILICLDDVWRVDDAKWFIFDTRTGKTPVNRATSDPFPYRILITTRTPSLLGPGVVQEVFVRIFSEHEAVKLLLSSAGRRPYGGKQSAVFNQARIIVKGCGNSPMAVRLAGGMLRRSNRNWNLSSPTWNHLIEQSKLNLEEASRLRSFANSVTRIVDLGFACVDEMNLRVALRRCFITFAVAFRDNDWVHIGKGIPQAVVLKMFAAVIDSKQHTAEELIATLEMMNLLERARHGTTAHSIVYKKRELSSQDSDDGEFEDEEEETGPTKSTFLENPSFVMQDSLRAIGEDVAKREEPAFLPKGDTFTSFTPEIKEEQKYHDSRRGIIGGALRFLSKSLSQDTLEEGLRESEVHRMVAACLVGVNGRLRSSKVIEAFRTSRETNKSVKGGDKLEEYMAVFLPSHLIRSQYFAAAGELLIDPQFIRRRVKCLGAAEATRKQVVDLLELRREFAKEPNTFSRPKSTPPSSPQKTSQTVIPAKNGSGDILTAPTLSLTDSTEDAEQSFEEPEPVDTSLVLRDGCRTIVDEVHRVVSNAKGSAESLSMAICLSTVGEALMKGKQPRDAMLRLEEAVIIYRSLLGENHVDVARSLHSVARALVKLGENRVALHKFTEAAEIYDRCNANMHFDSIANSQNLATLLVDLGEWDKAAQYFDDVIRKKKIVYGEGSVSVAKAINSYAILLAKHGRMHEALANYEAAKATYEAVPPSLLQDAEFDIKCKYDITLINLNIASIRSKKGDLQGAIKSYADGVRGLRQYEAAQEKLMATTGAGEIGKNTSHVKHLVAALGRIGSLKLKVGDNSGALEAYKALLAEVAEDSPQASKVEAAKAHIKCATIYRQEEGSSAHSKSISHLREALEMYTLLFGPDHKDTLAIASSLRQWLAEQEPAK